MKKGIYLFLCILLATSLAYLNQNLNKAHGLTLEPSLANEQPVLKQDVLAYTDQPQEVHKLYEGTRLVGVISDYDKIENAINDVYLQEYKDNFPDTELGFGKGINVVKENVYYRCEDIDDQIIQYLLEGNHLGVKVTSVEFSTGDGVYDAIYVKNIEDFYTARNQFLRNFINEDTLTRLENRQEAPELKTFGTQEIGAVILETMTASQAVVSADQIFMNASDIYTYLCYGRNPQYLYYTVKEGDTLAGVGRYYRDMSAQQLMLINPGVLKSPDQILTVGMEINVAYYQSPITVVVTKERLSSEPVYPAAPQYIEDPEMLAGTKETITEEANGAKNVLHEETWINGVLQAKEVILSEVVTLEPVQAVIRVGTKPVPNIGTGNIIWPVDNPIITCRIGCYYGHLGTDIQNMYNRYGDVYAIDNGTVVNVGYDGIGGNWIIIDHNNGYTSYYGHMHVPAYPQIGDTVQRGQVIGQIGMTGYATGPHVHLEIRTSDGTRIDACSILPCNSVPR